MSEDRVRASRFIILSGTVGLLSVILFLLALLWIQWEKKQEEKNEFIRRASIQAQSSLNLVRYELLCVPPNDRWSANWTLNGNYFIYTDLDGTRYENYLEKDREDYLITTSSDYRGVRVQKSCRLKGENL